MIILLTGFSSLNMIAEIRIKTMVEDLHMVYIDTVMYMKLQLERAMSNEAAIAGEKRGSCHIVTNMIIFDSASTVP